MSRKYRHLKEYEKELIEHINQGHTLRETGEKYGFQSVARRQKIIDDRPISELRKGASSKIWLLNEDGDFTFRICLFLLLFGAKEHDFEGVYTYDFHSVVKNCPHSPKVCVDCNIVDSASAF